MNKDSQPLDALDAFADLDRQGIRGVIAASSDIALLVTAEGIVRDIYIAPETRPANDIAAWSGADLNSLVTEESREKVAAMLAGARTDEAPRWREINHVTSGSDDFPVRYAAIRSGTGGDVILLGRDLRMVAQLQTRLMQAQLTMEQDYERIRQIETRYRVLFETTREALFIVSADTGRVIDANGSAARLFGRDVRSLVGRPFVSRFEAGMQGEIGAAFAQVRETGRERSLTVRSRGDVGVLGLDMLLFRSVQETLFLCRLTPQTDDDSRDHDFERSLSLLYSRSADAIVFTGTDGQIRWANTAFLALADIAVGDSVAERNLADFLAQPNVDLPVMMTNARTRGRLSAFTATLRSAYGTTTTVEITTTFIDEADEHSYGFILRDVARSTQPRSSGPGVSSEAVEHIIELVGSTPLKELVRGTTDVVEKLCIETAIKLTNNNRASAAEMLGLSRQSLYVKLRRYGLIDQDEAPGA